MKLQNIVYISWGKIWQNSCKGYEWQRGLWKIEQINKNDEIKVFDIVEDLKLGIVETESDKIYMVDMSDEKESVERDEIHKNDDVTLTDIDE